MKAVSLSVVVLVILVGLAYQNIHLRARISYLESMKRTKTRWYFNRTLNRLRKAIPDADRVSVSPEYLRAYSKDKSEHSTRLPDIVVFPRNTSEVSRVMKICNEENVPVIAAGSLAGQEGHDIPIRGVVLDTLQMNKILQLNEKEMQVSVECGVTRTQLATFLDRKGLFFAVDPESDATLGRYAATSAGSMLTAKYGTIRENIVQLIVVLADCTVVSSRPPVRKSTAGYDLHDLFIGSEGTLGIIAEMTLKVHYLPKLMIACVVYFNEMKDAVESAMDLVKLPLFSLARCEILNSRSMKAINLYNNTHYKELPSLFLEFHGDNDDQLRLHMGIAMDVATKHDAVSHVSVSDKCGRDALWQDRRNVYYSIYELMPKSSDISVMTTDVCVPISFLAEIIEETEKDFQDQGIHCPLVAHAADGIFNLLIPFNSSNMEEKTILHTLKEHLVKRTLERDGTVSGEHGGGLEALRQEKGKYIIELMKKIKAVFDPMNIMNPGKILERRG